MTPLTQSAEAADASADVASDIAAPAASATDLTAAAADSLAGQFYSVRRQSETLAEPLSAEDMMVQSCPEASPVKWHLAHTTWFFETFLLREFLPGYRPFHPDFLWLFNSYYNAVSDQPAKQLRSSFSRPGLAEILEYRRYVESAMERLMEHDLAGDVTASVRERIVLGLNHEQQHQELIVMDVKHAMWTDPLHPAYVPGPLEVGTTDAEAVRWVEHGGGLCEIGARAEGFAFDNESPRHKEYLEPFALASRAVTCAEYREFIEDRGYERPELWLSEGWDTVRARGWTAPLYWHRESADAEWSVFTLKGNVPLAKLAAAPVCHVSYFEADAFARWAGKRLPTEAEWEVVARNAAVEGNLLESGTLHPMPAGSTAGNATGAAQLFGDVWEWTASAYLGYPGFDPLPGALGEYNGKFMCNQMVLRGGSVATPASHIRASYRNFFSPATRWVFGGVRLAKR